MEYLRQKQKDEDKFSILLHTLLKKKKTKASGFSFPNTQSN